MTVILGIVVALFAGFLIYVQSTSSNSTSIAGFASRAGFSGIDLDIAVAIALAESRGDASAIGDLDLGRSIGLWQINLAAHPEYSEEYLLDPQNNAIAAFDIYQRAGNSFSPWTTFRTGAYLANMAGSFSAGTGDN